VNVCFVRHGPAVPSGTAGVADPDRRLTPDGRKKTTRAFEGLRRLNPGIDEIHTSPLPRALETAEILARVLRLPRPNVTDQLLPEASGRSILEVLKGVKGKAPALVGHEPGLSAALGLCLGSAEASSFRFKKAGVAVVELPRGTSTARGLLRLFLAPAALRELARR
jgi:phosphohistidine phosphatase SixA